MVARLAFILCLSFLLPLRGGDLPVEFKARIIKVIAASAGFPGHVCCKDSVVLAELAKAGITHDPGAKVAYATTEAEVHALRKAGKLILVGRSDLIAAGAAVAIVEEDNRPSILFSMANLSASQVTLSDSVLKIGRKI